MSEQEAQQPLPVVLFVDDQPDIREYFEICIPKYHPRFEPIFADSREAALRAIRQRQPAAVILDVNLVGETGMSVAEDMREFYPHILKAVLTAYDRSVTRANAEEFGMEVWSKPILMPELIAKVEGLLASADEGVNPSLRSHAVHVVKMLAATVGLLGGAHVHKVH